jgi:uncharacterized protein YkwD
MSSYGLQTAPIDILTPNKKKIAVMRKKSDIQELKEMMKRREQNSSRRKTAVSNSLGRWETGYNGSNHSHQSTRRKTREVATPNKKQATRNHSADGPSPTSLHSKKDLLSFRTRSTSPGALRRNVSGNRDRSTSPHGLRNRVMSKRPSNANSREKIRSTGSGGLGNMLNSMRTKKPIGVTRSVASAPSHLLPEGEDQSLVRPTRRASRFAKGSGVVTRKARRTKSSDLTAVSDGIEKAATKKKKRRAKSVDAAEKAASASQRQSRKEMRGKKKAPKKKRPDSIISMSESISSTTGDLDSDQEEKEEKSGRRGTRQEHRSRRPVQTGTKSKPGKRSKSAGPLERNQEVGSGKSDSRPMRANSMMLNRDMTRRSKSNSLGNLVKYADDEIHSTSYFASNHVLINRERMKRGLRALTRNIAMDTLARENAQAMAKSAGCSQLKTTYVGNVLRGESIRAVHRATMLNKEGHERANLLNPYFQDFGVGTSKGDDGMLYVCQLFSERLELQCTDVAGDEDSDSDSD